MSEDRSTPRPPPPIRPAGSRPEATAADPVVPRRSTRRPVAAVAALVVAVGLAAVVVVVTRQGGGDEQVAGAATTSSSAPVPTTTTLPPTTTTTLPPGPPAAEATLGTPTRINGHISPKSVAASGHGIVFAQNMMYTHTVTAYAADGTLLATIPDSVTLSDFGVTGHPGTSQGAPVEAAFTHDGRYAYVSNYSMYGNGWGPEGSDTCTPDDHYDDSFVYRIDTTTMQIDQVIAVGAVPKFVAVTPDDRTVLVTNWCSYDLSVVDVASAAEVARVPLGHYPRGIVVSPDSTTAWIGVMGEDRVVEVDLTSPSYPVHSLGTFGDGPRHVLLSPDGSALFVSHNRSGTVVRIDTATGRETARVSTGTQPRSMAIASDGTAIYVANYESSTLTKLRASDLAVLQEVPTDHHAIGATYEPTTHSVWVACYGGSILVFPDR